MTYRFARRDQENTLDHADCIWEEWHAYLSDDVPHWASRDSVGFCCHTHRLVIVETGITADLDRSEEAVPAEVDEEPSYEYRCIGSVVCDQMLDVHGRECQRVNDQGRTDFYEDLVPDQVDLVEAVRWHARRATPAVYAGDLGAWPELLR